MSKALACVVTGASRGVGRGVALAMGAACATVYVMAPSRRRRAPTSARSRNSAPWWWGEKHAWLRPNLRIR